ncbi:hypothetical protein LDVICp050 [lymphocystis disease virus-China]|uniref:Uncharacterized protein n=1 Tax=lymphocystis disease virus-China TaxID=256729 RepID=Q678G1_9VIRU|nr:hypothetical protein LDVICp050 [lymphocystis disease virus-China]AAU10896.1 hypothetical protein [lymphocystis disease virus-China]
MLSSITQGVIDDALGVKKLTFTLYIYLSYLFVYNIGIKGLKGKLHIVMIL